MRKLKRENCTYSFTYTETVTRDYTLTGDELDDVEALLNEFPNMTVAEAIRELCESGDLSWEGNDVILDSCDFYFDNAYVDAWGGDPVIEEEDDDDNE